MNRLFVVVPWPIAILLAPFWAIGLLTVQLSRALWQAGQQIVRDARA